MKYLLGLALLTLALFPVACAYDNFEPPESILRGAVVYEGEPVGVRQNGIDLQLWEPGFELDGFIPVNVHQDGTFSSKLFNGTYKLVRKNGPWLANTDTINVEVNGDQTTNVPVTPFFVIRNENIALNGTKVSATFDVKRIVGEAELQSVSLFINSRRFVDLTGPGNVASVSLNAGEISDLNGIELGVEVPENQRGQEGIFARIGVKTVGVPELLYSQVQEVAL